MSVWKVKTVIINSIRLAVILMSVWKVKTVIITSIRLAVILMSVWKVKTVIITSIGLAVILMSVWKVKTVIITSIRLAVILVTMYVETFKTAVVLYVDHCEIKNSNKNAIDYYNVIISSIMLYKLIRNVRISFMIV